MTETLALAATPKRSLSLTSLIVVPLKQHLGCCVIVPLLLKTMGTVGVMASLMKSAGRFDVVLSLGLAPFIVWLCLWLEDRFHVWQHRRGHFAAACNKGEAHVHAPDCGTCAPCPVNYSRRAFWRRYLINLAIACVVISLIELTHHHHT